MLTQINSQAFIASSYAFLFIIRPLGTLNALQGFIDAEMRELSVIFAYSEEKIAVFSVDIQSFAYGFNIFLKVFLPYLPKTASRLPST